MSDVDRARPMRQIRRDGAALRKAAPTPIPAPSRVGASGRMVVLALAGGVLLIWGGLSLGMNRWKADYQARAEFGRSQVATVADGFAPLKPAGIPSEAWSRAVADTHQMLVALTASGVLDRPAMDRLRADLLARLGRSKSETAVADLAGLWDEIEANAGPVVAPSGPLPGSSGRYANRTPRPPRPAILGPRSAPTRPRAENHN